MKLPSAAAFFDEAARAFDGETIPLTPSAPEGPMAVLRIGGYCVLLIQSGDGRYRSGEGKAAFEALGPRYYLTLPLETDRFWQVNTPEEWHAAIPEIQHTLAALAPVVTMADAYTRIPGEWTVMFSGDEVPRHTFLSRRPDECINFAQKADGIEVIVCSGSFSEKRDFRTLESLDDLPAWALQWTAVQVREGEEQRRADAEKAARDRLVLGSTPAEMLQAIREGLTFETGGGRLVQFYKVNAAGEPICDDEDLLSGGNTYPLTEDILLRVMAESPDYYLEMLEKWKRR